MSLKLTSSAPLVTISIDDANLDPNPVWTVESGNATVTPADDGLSATFAAPTNLPDTSEVLIAFSRAGVAGSDTVTVTLQKGSGNVGSTGGLSFSVA